MVQHTKGMQKYNDSTHRKERKIRKLIISESEKYAKIQQPSAPKRNKNTMIDDAGIKKKTLENTTIQHTEEREKYED